jgi:hypothetical protein
MHARPQSTERCNYACQTPSYFIPNELFLLSSFLACLALSPFSHADRPERPRRRDRYSNFEGATPKELSKLNREDGIIILNLGKEVIPWEYPLLFQK